MYQCEMRNVARLYVIY